MGEFPNKATQFTSENQPEGRGRPKGSVCLISLLKKYLDQEIDLTDPITKERVKRKVGDVVILKLLANAISGDSRAIKEILDRLHGKTGDTGVNVYNVISNNGNGNGSADRKEVEDRIRQDASRRFKLGLD